MRANTQPFHSVFLRRCEQLPPRASRCKVGEAQRNPPSLRYGIAERAAVSRLRCKVRTQIQLQPIPMKGGLRFAPPTLRLLAASRKPLAMQFLLELFNSANGWAARR